VPVEFLTDEQAEAYGTFTEVPTRPELERFFFLDDDDRDLIALRRTDAHRLGMAVQICTVRYVGRFLGEDPLAVPWEAVEYLAGQLGIADASCVKRYPERRSTVYEHAAEIQERFKYRDFTDRRWGREFRGFLYGRAWTHAEGPVALFNHAVTWLRKNRVLLPGVTVLARQVSEARTVAERRVYEAVARAAHRADPALALALAALLVVPEGKRVSELERLRTQPVKSTGTAMVQAMERVEEISAFALGRVNLSRVPVNRPSTLARYGQLSKAQTIERAPEPRRTALLTAVVRQMEAQAVDDALDLFAVLMANRLISPARRASERERLAMLPQLEKAARILAKASKILTEELDLVAEHEADLDVAALWAAVEEAVPRTAVAGAVATVEALVPEDDGSAEAAMREKLALRYNTVRPFLALLGESDALGAAPAGRRLLQAVRHLPGLSRRRVKDRPLLPREVDAELVPAMWKRAVFSNAKLPQGAVDRDAYVVCVLEQLHRALNRRDVFAVPSNRWADPRARLLDGVRWEAMRADVLAGLSLTEDAGEHLAQLTRGLDAAWRQMADRAHRDAVAGHAPGRRVAHHQPGPGLRPAADVRPRGPPHPAGGGVRRVRADRQDLAPARPARPDARRPRSGPPCRGAVEHPPSPRASATWPISGSGGPTCPTNLDAAVARLRAAGHDIKDEDVVRLSPLKDRHINFLGRYLFNIKASGPGQGLRPFRDPDAIEDEGEDD
jgi:hypothetical protein